MPQFDDITKKVPEKIKTLPSFQACAGQAVVACSGTAARNQADETKDHSWCDAIPDDVTKRSCKDSLAYAQILASGSVDDCSKLENGNLKTQCKTRLVSKKAAEDGKIEQCDTLIIPADTLSAASGASNLPIKPPVRDENDRNREADDCRMQVIQRMDRAKLTTESCDIIQTADIKTQCSGLVNMLRQTVTPAPQQK